jgi:hypothetical protein
MMSTNVVALSDKGIPFCLAPCSDGIRPVIKVARFGMHIGVAT